jgi:FkbM family methyltransferase
MINIMYQRLLKLEHILCSLLINEKIIPKWIVKKYGFYRCKLAGIIFRSKIMASSVSPNRIIACYLNKGDTYIDIGAANGEMMCVAAGRIEKEGQIVAFEPRPEAILNLQAMVTRLHFYPNVVIENKLVGSENSLKKLYIDVEHPTSSSIFREWVENRSNSTQIQIIETQIVTLNSWGDENPYYADADMIKIDVEGAEHEVIAGALNLLKNGRPILLIEIGATWRKRQSEYFLNMIQNLASINYSIYSIKCHKLNLNSINESENDFIFINNNNKRHRDFIERMINNL